MNEAGWPEENWNRLGELIAEARRRRGWDQVELARRSANSANTISNYERGRPTRTRRVPRGVGRVEQVLGWPRGTAQRILEGLVTTLHFPEPLPDDHPATREGLMIPNSAPMAAVYLDDKKTLSAYPVAAWDADGDPLVCFDYRLRFASDHPSYPSVELLGLWLRGWDPTYDQMTSLLPEHTPSTRHPLSVGVTVRQTPFGWAARLTSDESKLVCEQATYEDVERVLSVLGNYHVDEIVPIESSPTPVTVRHKGHLWTARLDADPAHKVAEAHTYDDLERKLSERGTFLIHIAEED